MFLFQPLTTGTLLTAHASFFDSLNEMTGVFTAEILSQIAGQTTAPLQAATTGSVRTTGTAAATTTHSTGTTSARSTSASATGSSAAQNNGVISTRAGWAGVIVGAIAGAALF
jgi:hypothetical protein